MPEMYLWWQRAVIYQIYPRSFMDSNGDGTGDLPGITGKLDYLQWLGVDAIWISPIFPSPMADFGYDVANYTDIEPLFGTLRDFDTLIEEAHRRGLRLLLDFVPNHTSDQHPWFQESRSSLDNSKRDWYLWHDPATDGGPPNNWLSRFGGSGWEWDEATGQYYYHSFLKEQPDLNWRNPEVKEAMFNALRFWLDRGVDGFRVDVIYFMIKDAQFRDNPPDPNNSSGDPWDNQLQIYTLNMPEVHDLIREFRQVLDSYPERVMIGEIYLPNPDLVEYYGANLDECHLPFNFALIDFSSNPDKPWSRPWNADALRKAIEDYEAALPPGAWPNWVLGNHDQHRIATRIGPRQARVAQMLLLTLRGTITCYYGDELGMHDVPIAPDQVKDPFEKNVPGIGLGRDPERTPMQWGSEPFAGFSTVEPWLPVADDYETYNVKVEREQPNSMLTLVRRLLSLRRASRALSVGSIQTVPTGSPDLLAYMRESEGERFLVVLNLSSSDLAYDFESVAKEGTLLVSTRLDREGVEHFSSLHLRRDEGLLLSLPSSQTS